MLLCEKELATINYVNAQPAFLWCYSGCVAM